MKHKLTYFLTAVLPVLIILVSCEPQTELKPSLGNPPDSTDLAFTISPGEDDFHFVFTNASVADGIASWELGNGSKATGEQVISYYPMPDTYTVTMTLYAKGGSTSTTKTFEQTETDYSLFTDPKYVNLTGGADDLDGKTWMLDSLSKGHLGVGPPGTEGLAWWSADPLQKSGVQMYDDEINFKLNGFKVTYENNGISYVKDFRKDDPAYSNPVQNDVDYMVEYTTPIEGTWMYVERNGKVFLVMGAATPIFPIFDTGADNGEYEVLKIEENLLELVSIGGDGNAWHYYLIPKGYVKPSVSYDVSVTDAGTENGYDISLANLSLPDGWTVSNVSWDFGEGSTLETTDPNHVETVTYYRKGTYTVSVTVEAGGEEFSNSATVDVADNHSSYVPYLLDEMVTYNDFGEVSLVPFGFDQADGSGSIVTVANPDKSLYPNRSNNVGLYTKVNSQWANAYLLLPTGYRFDLEVMNTFKLLVYGKAGDVVLLKLENTDRGGDAWMTGAELTYTIQSDDTWEVATYEFAGVGAGWDWTGDIYTSDITTDPRFNTNFYNVIRIMYNPGDNSTTYSFYLDDLAGPHVEGLK